MIAVAIIAGLVVFGGLAVWALLAERSRSAARCELAIATARIEKLELRVAEKNLELDARTRRIGELAAEADRLRADLESRDVEAAAAGVPGAARAAYDRLRRADADR